VFYREQYGIFTEKHFVASSAASPAVIISLSGRIQESVFIHIKLFVSGHRKYQMKEISRKEALEEKERRVRGSAQ
jgi:hypothetical protein